MLKPILVCAIWIAVTMRTDGLSVDWRAMTDSLTLRCDGGAVLVPEQVRYAASQPATDCVLQAAHVAVVELCFRKTACNVIKLSASSGCDGGATTMVVLYECVANDAISTICPGTTLPATVKYIASDNYPQTYSASVTCASSLAASAGNVYLLTLLDMEIDWKKTEKECNYDRLVLQDTWPQDGPLFIYCGHWWKNVIGYSIAEFYTRPRIEFKSDLTTSLRGFLLKVELKPEGAATRAPTTMPTVPPTTTKQTGGVTSSTAPPTAPSTAAPTVPITPAPSTTTVKTTGGATPTSTTTTKATASTTPMPMPTPTSTPKTPTPTIDPVNNCLPEPCKNDATCVDDFETFKCTCAAGFSGITCAIRGSVDDCSPNPCANGGTCHDDFKSYLCDCATGYSGRQCESVSAGMSLAATASLLATIAVAIFAHVI